MGKTIDCYFWNPNLGIEDNLEFTYEDVGNGIELKKPVFTIESLNKIIEGIKQARKEYLLKVDIPTVIDVIGRVNNLWMDLMYTGRKIAREVLPIVTGFSVEMVESWGFDYFLSIIKKENLPLFGKLQPSNFKIFSKLNEGLVKAYGEAKISHSNYEPEVIGHICAGNIMGLAAFEMVMDKLVDAATWIKVPSEEPVFGALYAKSIEEVNPKLAYTIAVLPFDSKDEAIKEFLFSKSNLGDSNGYPVEYDLLILKISLHIVEIIDESIPPLSNIAILSLTGSNLFIDSDR